MKTERKTELKERFKKNIKSWKIEVKNILEDDDNKKSEVITEFDSDNSDIEKILHKIELDLYTNLEYEFKTPIEISIIKVEKKESK